MSELKPLLDTSRRDAAIHCLTGLDIHVVYSSTAFYLVAYTSDNTNQLLLSLDEYTEPGWHAFLEAAAEQLDESFNPGPETVDKNAPGKAVEIYLLLPYDLLSKTIIKDLYTMINSRVVFRIKNQAHIPHRAPHMAHGDDFHLVGAPNPSIFIGPRELFLSRAEFYEFDAKK